MANPARGKDGRRRDPQPPERSPSLDGATGHQKQLRHQLCETRGSLSRRMRNSLLTARAKAIDTR